MTYTEEKPNTTASEDDVLEEYYTGEELSDLEAHVLAGKVQDKIEKNRSRLSFINHLRAFGKYLFDRDVKWYRKSVVVAALVYFITPVDAIPDLTPFAGFLDDLGVITAAIKFLGNELKQYYG
jgi:uncharacterized membrane protein YkvA (DUF1232 family)